jgi:hypothetical protein
MYRFVCLSLCFVFSAAPWAQAATPPDWTCIGGNWQIEELSRPLANKDAVVAVESKNHTAFPGICKTKGGDLLVVYRDGLTHASGKAEDGRIMAVRSTDGGATWSKPAVVVDDPKYDDRNAAVSCMKDGTLCVVFDKYLAGAGGNRHHFAWLTMSKDDGKTWSEPIKVSKTENVHTRSRALDLGNGKWLIPYSESTNSPSAASFVALFDPESKESEEIAITPRGNRPLADETSVVQAADGRLIGLIRSNWDPELFQVESTDGGKTWSDARPSGIPSQFTPCEIIQLNDGRLVTAFSFRERRDERLVVSRDGGKTWDVENSIDIYDGTRDVGGDRSYPSCVQIDDETLGCVVYETKAAPTGGRIYFVKVPVAALDPPKEPVLAQADPDAEAAFALWPEDSIQDSFVYRFAGKFGTPPNLVGLLLDYKDPKNYTALVYQMGVGRERKGPTNWVKLIECKDGIQTISQPSEAKGDWFNDGNVHQMKARLVKGEWVFSIDNYDQFSVPEALGKPCGVFVSRASVAVYNVPVKEIASIEELRAERKRLAHRKRRIIFNNDGCDAVYYCDEATPQCLLEDRTTNLLGKQVDTIAYCTWCSGFGYFTHATKLGDVFDTTSVAGDPKGRGFSNNKVGAFIEQGTDPLDIMVDFCKKNGVEVWWTMRMNDTHDRYGAWYSPYLYSPFKKEYPGCVIEPNNPKVTAVNYGMERVRETALAYIREVCENYDVDGVDLDFYRHLLYFPSNADLKDATREERDMMTDLMRKVRAMTEEVGMKRGRPILVSVRVPDDVGYCKAKGFDIEKWLEEGLIDTMEVTGYVRLNPWEKSVALGHKYDVPVFAGLSETRLKDRGPRGTVECYRGRAMNAWAAGVDAIYLFNAFNPNHPLWNELGDPEALESKDKLFTTGCRQVKNYINQWLKDGDRFLGRDPVSPERPKFFEKDETVEIDLTVGQQLGSKDGKTPTAELRLRLADVDGQDVAVTMNGTTLSDVKKLKEAEWFSWPVDPKIVRNGANKITVTPPKSVAKRSALKDVVLWVRYK